MKQLLDVDVSGKKVFLRADLDVPVGTLMVNGELKIEEATRLTNLKPTVGWLLEHGARQIIIAGHIDRPTFAKATVGKPPGYNPALSTERLIEPLEKILGQKIILRSDPFSHPGGSVATDRISNSDSIASLQNDAKVALFENLRFWPGEEKNDPEFAKQLATLADIYINDSFATCHRAHASMVGVPVLFADVQDTDGVHSRRVAGFHLQKEVEVLSKLLESPKKPFVAIVGGAKLETKIPVIANLAKVADKVLVGGAIAKELNLRQSSGQAVESGKWKVDENKVVVATLTSDTKDIDQASIDKFKSIIMTAKTIVWNGPMGLFEEGHNAGGKAVAEAIIASGAYSVVGGGETTEFLGSYGFLDKFSFVSSGGGAMLEFLSGKELPGIIALK